MKILYFLKVTATARTALSGVLDELEPKFGDGAIMKGSLWERNHSGIGDNYSKASNTIPDDLNDDSKT